MAQFITWFSQLPQSLCFSGKTEMGLLKAEHSPNSCQLYGKPLCCCLCLIGNLKKLHAVLKEKSEEPLNLIHQRSQTQQKPSQ